MGTKILFIGICMILLVGCDNCSDECYHCVNNCKSIQCNPDILHNWKDCWSWTNTTQNCYNECYNICGSKCWYANPS